MKRRIFIVLAFGGTLAGLGCPLVPQNGGTTPSIVVEPSVLVVPTGGVGEFTVALSADPGRSVALNILCVSDGCGFSAANSVLSFDSSNFSTPQVVVVTDVGFQGSSETIFEVSGADLTPANVTVIWD